MVDKSPKIYNRPTCIRLSQWLKIVKASDYDPCIYCTPEYQALMLRLRKCESPLTKFYLVEYSEADKAYEPLTEVFGSRDNGKSILYFLQAWGAKLVEEAK